MSRAVPVLKRTRKYRDSRERTSATKPPRQRTCYFSETLERETRFAPSVSGRLSRLAELVAQLRAQLLPAWDPTEWAVVMEALRNPPSFCGPHMTAWLVAERIQINRKAIETNYRIKVDRFLPKLEELDMAQSLLVWDVAERFHQTPEEMPFQDRMEAAGVELPGRF